MKIKFNRSFPSASILLTIAAAWLLASHPAAGQAVATPDHLDPATGQAAPAEQWLSSDWAGPTSRLATFDVNDMPLTDVAKNLRSQFKESFDLIIPDGWKSPGNPDVSFDLNTVMVTLRMKNVSALELFSAMNLEFETENSPVRWELKNNVQQRPLAILHIIPALVPGVWGAGTARPAEKKSMVYFVGDLLDNRPGNGQGPFGGGPSDTMDKLFDTVSSTYNLAYQSHTDELKYHKEAQLIVVTATPDRIAFVQSTLAALRDKKRLEDSLRAQATAKKPDGAAEATK